MKPGITLSILTVCISALPAVAGLRGTVSDVEQKGVLVNQADFADMTPPQPTRASADTYSVQARQVIITPSILNSPQAGKVTDNQLYLKQATQAPRQQNQTITYPAPYLVPIPNRHADAICTAERMFPLYGGQADLMLRGLGRMARHKQRRNDSVINVNIQARTPQAY